MTQQIPSAPPRELAARTFEFARRVLAACPPAGHRHPPSAQAWDQVTRAATSVGANVEESRAASSRADFRFRMKVALREAREARYWLRLIVSARLEGHTSLLALEDEANQLVAILTAAARRLDRPRS